MRLAKKRAAPTHDAALSCTLPMKSANTTVGHDKWGFYQRASSTTVFWWLIRKIKK
jgi:hypothetical protein